MGRHRLVAAVLAGFVLVLAAGAGLYAASGLLDRDRLRDALASVAAAAIGRPVRIEGALSLSLLPEPTLTAERIDVPDAGDGVTLSARSLRLGIALGPLLAGRVAARTVVLRGATLRLPWPVPPVLLRRAGGLGLAGLSARVEEGRLSVGSLDAEAIDATLSTDEANGLEATGSLRVGGLSWHATGRLGAADAAGGASLALSVDGQGAVQDTGARFDGRLAADGTVDGQVAGSGPDLSRLGRAPPLPWRARGPLLLAGGQATAANLALTLGGAPAHAAAVLRLGPAPRLDLSFDAGRLDLDAWVPLLGGAAPALPIGLDLLAGTATVAGGPLRQLRASLVLGPDGTVLRQGSAVLPGAALLRLAGRLDPGGSPTPWRFAGTAALAGADLRPVRRWLLPFAPALGWLLPEDAAGAADLHATVVASPGALALTGLDGTLDGARVGGSLALRLPPAPAPPGITADLRAEGLVLDPFGPPPLPSAWLQAGWEQASWAQVGAALAAAGKAPSGLEGTLRLDAADSRWRGVPLPRLSLEAGFGPRLTLRRLQAAFAGAQLAASGSLGPDGSLANAQASLTADDASGLAALLPVSPPGAAQDAWHGPLAVALAAAGPSDALALRLHAELADATFEANPVLDLPAGRGTGSVTLRHPGAQRLFGLLLGGSEPDWLGEGSLAVLARISTAPGQVSLDGLDLTAGGLRATGELRLDTGTTGRTVSGRLVADTLPLPWPDGNDTAPLPLGTADCAGWRGTVQLSADRVVSDGTVLLRQASATLALDDDTLRLNRLAGTFGGGTLSADAALALGTSRPPALLLRADLHGAAVAQGDAPPPASPLGLRGRLDAQASLTASGYSPAALLATLAGPVSAVASDGTMTGFDLPALGAAFTRPPADLPGPAPSDVAALRSGVAAALSGGETPFNRLALAGEVANGMFLLRQGMLHARAGDAAISGSVDLLTAQMDLRLGLRPAGPGLPELGLRLRGFMAAPDRTPELASLGVWLSRAGLGLSPAEPMAGPAPPSR